MSIYPRIAWATAMIPISTEHYQNLLKHKVKDVVICLHLSDFKRYETGEIHTRVARETGMRIHAGLITNLANPLEDTKCFYRAYRELNYTSDAKVSIFCLKTYVVTNREKRLQELLRYLSCFIDKENIDVVAAFEFWQNAINVYKANFNHPVFKVDLSKVKDMSMFAKYEPDIIIGGPPCQDYSSAGKRDESCGRADKTIDYANIVKAVRPTMFVMENVDNISKYETLKRAKNIFKSANYGLTQVVLDASYFNVPQKRKRFFLIGVLNGKDDELRSALEKKILLIE